MNSFLSNSTFRVTFSANNIETAKLISELCGNKTVEQQSQNKPKFLDFNPASRSLHVSETQRALLLPQEVINLPRDDQIVLIESFPPIRSKKIKYFEDKFFTKRLLPPTPIPTQEPFDASKFMVGKRANMETDEEAASKLLEDAPDDDSLDFGDPDNNSFKFNSSSFDDDDDAPRLPSSGSQENDEDDDDFNWDDDDFKWDDDDIFKLDEDDEENQESTDSAEDDEPDDDELSDDYEPESHESKDALESVDDINWDDDEDDEDEDESKKNNPNPKDS